LCDSAPTIEEGVKSLAVIPLKSREKVYGTLNIAKKELFETTLFEKNLFNSIGQIISGAMERTSLYTENVKRLEELKTLYSISQEVASKLELRVILQKIMEKAVELLEAEAGEVVLWDSRKQNYATAIVQGVPDSLIGRELSSPSDGIVGEIITNKKPVLMHDDEHHARRGKESDSYHLKEVIGVPLNVREMIIGTMMIGSSDPTNILSKVRLIFSSILKGSILYVSGSISTKATSDADWRSFGWFSPNPTIPAPRMKTASLPWSGPLARYHALARRKFSTE
jgi:transcriptional regulator with GAF, ATPase, and Fis domain